MVDGVGRARKATRASGARGKQGQRLQQGGIIDTELFIDISNVQLVCPSCGKPSRVGHRVEGDAKVRFCRRCETELA
jgi:large subunit ribosomal protein L24